MFFFVGRGGFLKTSPLHKGAWKTQWWFQIFFIFIPFGEKINFDYYVSHGFKPPTRKWCSFLFTRVVFWFTSITKQFWVVGLSLNKRDSWRLWPRNFKQPKNSLTYKMGTEPIVRVTWGPYKNGFCSPELFFGLHPSLSSFGLVGYHSTNVIREGYDLGILNNQKIRSPTRWAPSRSLEWHGAPIKMAENKFCFFFTWSYSIT